MNEELSRCPVCGHDQFTYVLSCKDFVASGELFKLTRCQQCQLLFTNPRPDEKSIGRYYETSNYVSHSGKKRGLIYLFYDIIRSLSLNKKLSLLNSRAPKGKLLDAGCGLGYFLNAAKKNGWDAGGVDVSEQARLFVKETFGLTVDKEDAVKQYPEATYDVITMWHVLEHFHTLKDWVSDLKRILKKDGMLLIAVPNSNSYDASFYKEFWDGYDVPRHLYHFNHSSMEQLFGSAGMKITEKMPMVFDSYYISWRSEIHKKTFLGLIRAFFIGLISNLKASGNRNYSSVLYIIKHA